MPRGCWVAHVDVSDPEGYRAYADANAEAFAKFRGIFLVRGCSFESVEDHGRSRHVVIEFQSCERALAC